MLRQNLTGLFFNKTFYQCEKINLEVFVIKIRNKQSIFGSLPSYDKSDRFPRRTFVTTKYVLLPFVNVQLKHIPQYQT